MIRRLFPAIIFVFISACAAPQPVAASGGKIILTLPAKSVTVLVGK